MCGITGIYNMDGGEIDRPLLKRMNDLLDHRGPDDEGYYYDGNVGLGHKRLSIIDLKTGHQPIFNEDRTRLVLHNGEIYNYREIRAELEQIGVRFHTSSDTEVVLKAYETWGTDSVKKFNGMFAFCVWDRRTRTLFIARDRLGIKPFYYWHGKHRNQETFLFASEIKALLLHPHVPRTLNPESLADYLTFQNIIDEKTLFADVRKLLPGSWLQITEQGVRIESYWTPDFTKTSCSIEETLEEYESLLTASVKRHMISDVPVGFYLSGGFDSGAVSTIGAGLTDLQVQTFTGFFPDGDRYTETPCSRAVAEKIGARRHEIEIQSTDFIPSMPRIVYHLDEPRSGCVAFPAYHVSKLVSQQVKVVLTGHGGDELFAGYQAYKGVYYRSLLRQSLTNLPGILGGIRSGELTRILYFMLYPFFQPEVRHGLIILFSRNELKKLLTPEFYQSIAGYSPLASLERITRDAGSEVEATERLYLKTYLPDLFMIEDRVGMAHSIEARTPLCDNELVDFALRVPIKHKLHDHVLKYIPKEVMKNRLPALLYDQPKKGFPTPLAPWFRGPLRSHIYDTLTGERAESRGVFSTPHIRAMLDAFCKRRADTLYDYATATRIFALYSMELWFRIFIDASAVERPEETFFERPSRPLLRETSGTT